MSCRLAMVVLACGFLTAWDAGADERVSPEELQAIRREALIQVRLRMVYQRGHLLLSGIVADQDGKPVPEFTVEYPHARSDKDLAALDKAMMTRGILARIPEEISDTTDKVTGKDGRFRIDAKYVDFLINTGMTFRADGYYPTQVSMKFPIDAEENDAILKAVVNSLVAKEWALPKEVPVKKTMKVMMRKRGKPTKLDRWTVDLAINRKGERLAYQFSASEKQKSGLVTIPAKARSLPPRSLFLSAKRDEDGDIYAKKITTVGGYVVGEMATDVKIVMNAANPGEGFVRYEPRPRDTGDADIRYVEEPIRRGMPSAPETGYRPELSMTSDDLRDVSDKGIMFYFKCAGRYGRAQYRGYRLEKDHSKFVIRLQMELQPNGTRNLEAEE